MKIEILFKYLKISFVYLLILKTMRIDCASSDLTSSYLNSKKCCNDGEILSLKDNLYSCQNSPYYAPEFKERSFYGAFEKRDKLIGGISIPVCKNHGNLNNVLLSEITRHSKYEELFLSNDDNYCIDLLFDFNFFENIDIDENKKSSNDFLSPTVLYCDGGSGGINFESKANLNSIVNLNRNYDIPTVFNIRRCCQKGEIYKINQRACLPIDYNETEIETVDLIENLGFSDFFYAIRGAPQCPYAIVDYEVNVSDVSYVAGRLQVTAASHNYDVVNLISSEESACIDAGSSPGLMIVRSCRGVEYCRDNSCVRKCCPENQSLVNNTCTKLPVNMSILKWHEEIWLSSKILENDTKEIMNTTDYGILIGKPCINGMYPVYRHEGWHIVPEGKIHVNKYQTYEHHMYCTEMFYNYTTIPDDFYPFICFDDPPPDKTVIKTRFAVNASLLSISCAFLLLTLLVYICLPSLQNLHGKTLMCHVASLFIAFGCLAMISIVIPTDDDINYDQAAVLNSHILCKFLGYMMLFSFLSAFFWLNVMCFDIWWKFGSLRDSGRTTTRRRDDFKRFLTYCFYAWGLALVFAIIAVLADYMNFLPKNLRPGIGVERCWFASERGDYGEILFFTGPVSLQLLVNLIFFIMTARRCSMVKAEIQRHVNVDRTNSRSRRFEADKTKLILNVKLFVVMGISWLLEVASYFLNNYFDNLKWKSEFFYVSDVVNCLQGLLIFVLFVIKKKVFNALKRKFSKSSGKKRVNSTGGILDPYRIRQSPSSSTILSNFAVSSSP